MPPESPSGRRVLAVYDSLRTGHCWEISDTPYCILGQGYGGDPPGKTGAGWTVKCVSGVSKIVGETAARKERRMSDCYSSIWNETPLDLICRPTVRVRTMHTCAYGDTYCTSTYYQAEGRALGRGTYSTARPAGHDLHATTTPCRLPTCRQQTRDLLLAVISCAARDET
jgi:hypothetical protein